MKRSGSPLQRRNSIQNGQIHSTPQFINESCVVIHHHIKILKKGGSLFSFFIEFSQNFLQFMLLTRSIPRPPE
ncbi:hypothetical protein FKM82_012843 [Ascaphus truei]